MIRPLQPADQADVLALWNGHATFDPLTATLLHEKIWGDADFRSDLTSIAAHDGQLTGFIMGVLRQPVSRLSPIGYIKLLVVHASYRRQGLGSQLLRVTERVLQHAGAAAIRVCESAPNYLTPGLDQRDITAKRFFENHGYQQIDTVYNLTIDLTQKHFTAVEPEARLAARGITVRRAKTGDAHALLAVIQNHWPVWRAEVTKALSHHPISVHLALRQGQILGFSAYDSNNIGTAWFGPMGTVPSAEGQGLGRVLLWRCLHDQKAQGHTAATIPWVGPIDFYRRYANAQIARIFNRYEKQLHHETDPPTNL